MMNCKIPIAVMSTKFTIAEPDALYYELHLSFAGCVKIFEIQYYVNFLDSTLLQISPNRSDGQHSSIDGMKISFAAFL
jgi:hypothetical protein